MFSKKVINADVPDEVLVEDTLAGSRAAFGEIVTRYQSLVCSLGFSATGSVTKSEDIAQDTFIAAWKQLRQLREPAKLRSWLCGITRFQISGVRRREGARPLESLEYADAAVDEDPSPRDRASAADDSALLWRALETVPEVYREPLVLYYRQHQSIEHVAVLLELSEDTVKQRLSRGRKALQDKVLELLSRTLESTAPSKALTSSIMAMIPLGPLAVGGAGGAGASAAKGGLFKTLATTTIGGGLLGAFLGVAGGWLGTKYGIELTQSPRERAYMVSAARRTWLLAALFLVGAVVLLGLVPKLGLRSAPVAASSLLVFFTVFGGVMATHLMRTHRTQQKIRAEESPRPKSVKVPFALSYISKARFLGLPLIAVDWGNTGCAEPMRGWIAVGRRSYGGLIAVGKFALAPIAIGHFAVGGVALGNFSFGAVSFGALALGGFSLGGWAFGYCSLGGVAAAIHAAAGGAAWAQNFAIGGLASALHVNDAPSQEVILQCLSTVYLPAAALVGVCVLSLGIAAGLAVLRLRQTC